MASSIVAKMAVVIDGQTASFNKAMAQSQSQLKSFTTGVQSVGAALGITFGAVAVFNGIKAAVGIMAEFEATMSQVKAITGATGKEFEALQADALRLGAATKFTSTQVGQLQVAYGRLGFNTQEILDATEATLDLAAATGEDLAKSADVAGSTVRGFGLEARETQRVVDVMAASFNQTALGLDNFTESMKYVAPIAEAANISVEETTALLGVLADAGIRGSSAGTALRKIFGDLSKDGRPVAERLDELGKKGIGLTDAFDEVGRTAQTALLVLTKNRDKADQLTASFQNVTGEAAKMARAMSDNLTGDVEKLSSAWEGLILSLGKTDAIRGATQAITGLLNALSGTKGDPIDAFKFLAQGIKDGLTESDASFQSFLDRIKEIRRETGKPVDVNIVGELAEKYKLTEEQANALYRAILDVNKSLSFQEQVIDTFKEFQGYRDLTGALEDYKAGLYELIRAQQIRKDQLKQIASISSDGGESVKPQIEASKNLIASYYERINILNDYAASFQSTQDKIKASDATPAIIKNLTFYKKALTELNESFDSVALSQSGVTVEGQRFTAGTLSQLRVLAAGIAGNEEFIKSVERLKESFKNIDTTIKPPDISALLDPIKEIEVAAGGIKFTTLTTNSEEVFARFEAGLKKMAETTKTHVATIQDTFIDMGPLISNALVGVADALGSAIGGVGDFGDNIIKVIAGFARQFGEILIATGVAMLAAKLLIKNPYTAIIAGAALVALSSAAGAAISKSHSSTIGGGGGSAGGGGGIASANTQNINTSSTDSQDVKITGTIVGKGQDIWVILQNYENSNKFLKAGG
jgi:hypothetical protein